MKTTTKIAVACVALAGVAGAALTAQADSRWFARDGGPAKATQQAYGYGKHHGMRHDGGRDGGRHAMRFLEAFDTNDDGKLSQEEIDQSRSARFGKFDTDGDKSLSLAEYEQLWLDAMRERMVDRFQDLDADGDAKVTAAEFERPFAQMVRNLDRNGDGVVDRNDFQHDFQHKRPMQPIQPPTAPQGPGDNNG